MRALILSGGGSKGSYQAGAISYLMGEKGLRYEAFCGVSVGALNCAQMAQYKNRKAKEGIEALLSFWNEISTDQVYKNWFLGKISALWKPSVYNSDPLRKYISKRFDPERVRDSGKLLRVGAVSMDSGEYKVFSEKEEHLLDGILASAAYPVMFMTVPIEGIHWSDGGIRNVTPLGAAFELGATEADVIMCTPPDKVWKPLDKPNALDNLGRMMDIMLEEIIETDLKLALAYNELARHGLIPGKHYMKIRVIRPETSLPGSSLNFDDHIQEKIERGIEDAKKIVP